ncbi:MAG: restriction endonuclease subunit S [Solirubrobacteraceae bacterium]
MINELLAQLCRDGVPYKPLGTLLDYEQPGKYLVDSTAYDDSYETPVLTAGKTFILGYTDETAGIYPASAESPVVIFDDFTTATQWVDFAFKAKSSAMKMLTPKEGVAVDLRYAFFAMQTIGYRPQDHARQWIGTYSAIKIPVPPMEVQREIVRLLDSYGAVRSGLDDALEAEVDLRLKQKSHYRQALLGMDALNADAGDARALSELVEFTNGKAHERLVVPDGSIALLTARFISTEGRSARWVYPDGALTPARVGDIAMVMSDLPTGRALARCFYVEEDEKYTANQRVCLLRVRDATELSPRWLYHFLDRNPQLLGFDNGRDQTHLKKGQILDVRVPGPSFSEQELATAQLDALDATVTGLVLSLEAERGARDKQYEYYRDKLLTFEEAVS